MPIGLYIYKIRGLMNLKRYQNLFSFKQRSVAEHAWSVAKIAHALGKLESGKFGNEVNMGELLQRAIFHDDIELFTGDILSQTKRRTLAMKKAVEEVEESVFDEEFIHLIPSAWINDYRRYTLYAKDDTIEGEILKAADVIDTILEAVEEVKLGNNEDFKKVLIHSTEKLLDSPLKSVKYFLKYSLRDFGLDVHREYGERVGKYITVLETEAEFVDGIR